MSIQSFEKVELRTGVIPAALYAGKLRKVALAVFRSLAPRDVILRDVAKLNQTLYGKLVEELKLSKGDFVRITVKAFYDKDKGELSFEVPHVERLVF
ncbi:MAG: single- stranded DNA-binding family protein, partial [Nitrososphaerales archaeon]